MREPRSSSVSRETLHHELEVRGLDLVFARPSVDDAFPRPTEVDAPRSHLVEDGLRQLGLDLDLKVGRRKLVEALDGPDDRSLTAGTIESVQPEAIGKQIGEHAFESVQLGQRVLSDPDQDVDADIRT